MTPDRWHQVTAIFHAARQRDLASRAAFLAEACRVDPTLRRDVEAMLAGHDEAGEFGDTPLAPLASGLEPGGMAIVSGARLGPYTILAALGAGGMGEVYRARDTKLGRDVAIKILPRAFTSDPERLGRFEREARILASLNHPHIGAIYGLEEADGVRALVLELVEGQTLSDRIGRGPIPLDDALAIARQIADALDGAHEKGLVHRDLKPANIKLTPAGVVKLLDFGLAKVQSGDGSASDLAQSPTMTGGETREGMILGTAAYMSPEQARGKQVDKRTDIWAFGCVLYEMLTGRQAFAGQTLSDTIAAVLEREPDWRALLKATPVSIQRLLERCLDKDPKRRLHDIADARLELDEADAPKQDTSRSTARTKTPAWIAWMILAVFGVLLLAALVPAALYFRGAAPERYITRFEIPTPATSERLSFALSPDGRQLAFVALGEGGPWLWVRAFDQPTARPLPGTIRASSPFWAPDGLALGFFADGKLKRIDLAGGGPQVLADAPTGRGGTWNRDGLILFAPDISGGLMRVPAITGTPVAVTQLGSGQINHRWPQFLPDGHHFLFFVPLGRPETHGTYIGSLDGGAPTRVLSDETPAVYAPPGVLLVVRQGVLMALRFDPARAAVSGEPVALAQGIRSDPVFHSGFAVSATGVLAYRPGDSQRRQLVWLDRAGHVVGTVGGPDEDALESPALAPDAQRVAFSRFVQGNRDVWLFDVARGVASRFTFDPADDDYPVWSLDGRRVVFRSTRNGIADLFDKPASGGAGEEQPLLVTPDNKMPLDWSPDGRTLLFASLSPKTGSDLWALPLVGDKKPFPVVQTPFNEMDGQFSPDGRWLAYESDESGRVEIYLRPFPGPGGQWQVSTAGGSQPRWRPDGQELFYVAPDGHLLAAPITVAATGQAVQAGTPVALFATRLASGSNLSYLARQQYAVARDRRFLLNVVVDQTTASPITVVLNWDVGLKK